MDQIEGPAHPTTDLIMSSGVPAILDQIRPQWKSKRLIERVHKLLQTDPSSACQRLLNAAIQDLREKIVIAGLDIAKEAASANRMPPVVKPEDIENYSPQNIIDLSHHIGLLTRPEWRRVKRCYEIRRDLEHEDDEYEASVGDCVYIFQTTIDVILSKDPITIITVTDLADLVASPAAVALGSQYIEDYRHAPKVRQIDIVKMLIGKYQNPGSPEITKSNALNAIRVLRDYTLDQAKLDLSTHYTEIVARNGLDIFGYVGYSSAGLTPYFRKAIREDFFRPIILQLHTIGYHWRMYEQHGQLLTTLQELGGLDEIPDTLLDDVIIWPFKCYLGEPGGYGYGSNRKVFFSDFGAPKAKKLLQVSSNTVGTRMAATRRIAEEIDRVIANQDIQRRYDDLLDSIGLREPA